MYGAAWTGDRVAARLIAAFRDMRDLAIYSPKKGVFEPSRPIDGLDLITAVQTCLGRESPACYRLLLWARLRADGTSIREYCRDRIRPRSTYYHRRRRRLERIAAFLNEKRAGKVVELRPTPPISALDDWTTAGEISCPSLHDEGNSDAKSNKKNTGSGRL